MDGGVLEITSYGDWVKANLLIENLSNNKDLLRDVAKGARDFGNRYKTYLIKGILTNGAYVGEVWTPVSERYGRFKERTYGFSRSEMLRASGNYLKRLQEIKVTQKNYLVEMGFSRGALRSKGHRGGLTLRDYSTILEYGYSGRNIPPRPLWRPAWEKLGGYKGLIRMMESSVGKRLRKHGITLYHG